MPHTLPKNKKSPTAPQVFFRKRDLLVLGAVLLVAAVLFLAFWPRQTPGAVAVVTIGYGDAQTVREIPLSQDALIEIDAALPVHLQVQDGAIRFTDSVCPDHLCEDFGWLRHEGDWAACLPAGVTLSIREANTA